METLVLTDKNIVPGDDQIFSIIGKNSIYWKSFLEAIRKNYPDEQEVWHYYNDGKSWLFRAIRKKKTLFWIGVLKDTFRITFYFGDKAENLIDKSELPDTMKTGFKNGKYFGKLRSISIKVAGTEDIEHALTLTRIKEILNR